jgi:hypothetical protein
MRFSNAQSLPVHSACDFVGNVSVLSLYHQKYNVSRAGMMLEKFALDVTEKHKTRSVFSDAASCVLERRSVNFASRHPLLMRIHTSVACVRIWHSGANSIAAPPRWSPDYVGHTLKLALLPAVYVPLNRH